MRRWLRLTLRLLLLAVILVELLWLTRAQVLVPLLQAPLAARLGELLDAEVRIDELAGDLPYLVSLRGVAVRGRGGPIERLDAARIDVRLDPWRLLDGDLAGIVAAVVDAQRLDLRVSEPAPDDAAPAGTPDFASLLRLLPDGAFVRADEFTFATPDGTHRGALELHLLPGTGARQVELDAAGVEAELRLAASGELQALVTAVRLPELAALAGVTLPAHGGWLRAQTDLTFTPPEWSLERAAASVDLRALRTDAGPVESSRLLARYAGGHLLVPELRVHLPSLAIRGQALQIAFAESDALQCLRASRGRIDVIAEDLAPYAALLPEPVRALDLQSAQLALRLAGPRLELLAAQVRGPGLAVDFDRGSYEPDDALWPPTAADLRFVARGTRAIELPDVGPLQLDGTVRGELAVDADGRRGAAELTLGAGRLGPARWQQWTGRVELRGERLTAELTGAGIASEHVADLAAERIALRGSIACPGLRPDPDRVELIVDEGRLLWREHPFLVSATVATMPDAVELQRLTASSVAGTLRAEARVAERLAALGHDSTGTARIETEGLQLPALLGIAALPGRIDAVATASGSLRAPALTIAGDAQIERPIAHLLKLQPAEDPPLELRVQATLDERGIAFERCDAVIADDRFALGLRGELPLALDFVHGLRGLPQDGGLRGSVRGDWHEPQVGPVTFAGELQAGAGGLELRDGRLRHELGEASVRFTVARTLRELCAGTPLAGADAGGAIAMAGFDLASLPLARLGLEQFAGTADGSIRIGGAIDPAEPLALVQQAEVTLRDGALKFGLLPRLESVALHATATPRELRLEHLTALAGARPIAIAGRVTAGAADLIAAPGQAQLDFTLRADDALVWRSRGLKLRAAVDARLTGTADAMRLSGTADLAGGKLVRRISLLPDLQGRGGEAVGEEFELPALSPGIGRRVELDLQLRTQQPFVVRTSMLDTELRADLRLRGTAARPRLIGSVFGDTGVVRFPGARLELETLLATFQSDAPGDPDFQLAASGRRLGFAVDLRIDGTLRRPEITLTSSPPLPTEDLVVLLTTGQIPDRLREQSPREHALLASTLLAQHLFEDLFGSESTEAGESFASRIRFESGREVSRSGVESLLVEFRLDDRFALEGERDAYEDWNAGIVIRIKL